MRQTEKPATFMKRFSTLVGPSLATGLLIATVLSVYGCGDSATVNPVVELASLSVDPGTLQPGFSGGTTRYSVDLTSSTTSVTVNARPAVSGDSVSINGQTTTSRVITLDPPGSTTVVDIVVSESNTSSRAYTVRLVRAGLAGNNSLQSLAVSPGTLAPDFDPDTLPYTVTVANNVGSVSTTPTVQDSNATVTVNGQAATSGQARTITLNDPGQSTTITITVTGQNGNPKTYLIVVSRGVSNNNNLQGLTISPGTLSPSFRASTTDYTVDAASSVASVRVTPRLQDTDASMTVNGQAATSGQAQTITLGSPGQSTVISVVVTAQDGTQKLYTLVVSRAALSGNNNLQRLSVSPGSLSPSFSASRTSYSVSVGGRVESITVTAAPEDTNANLTIEGQDSGSRSISLPPGPSRTEVEVVVTAPNGIPKTYFIAVNREALSADNNLDTLSVSPGTLDPAFSSGTTQYTVEVATGVTNVDVTATKSDQNAVISGGIPNSGQANIPLDGPGTSKTVSITVAAPNGDTKTYAITVKRLAPSTDSNLERLTVSAGTLIPTFSPSQLTYGASVSANDETVTVSAVKSDTNAVLSSAGSIIAATGVQTGGVTVSLGRNTTTTVSIQVTAQDGISRKIYTINFFRPDR
ncbi:MAG: cadherin-like beta sandwich domain-containing protein [Nitrospira sp.]